MIVLAIVFGPGAEARALRERATSGAGPPLVKVSNWLTHIDHDWTSPVWQAEEPHAVVPGSRLVALPGRNHILQPDEPAVAMFVEEVELFLAE